MPDHQYVCPVMSDLLVKYKELLARLKEIDDQFKRIMAEKCPKDEVHCTCVPVLRVKLKLASKKIKDLEAQINRLENKTKQLEGILEEVA